jgi:hypothetical protein
MSKFTKFINSITRPIRCWSCEQNVVAKDMALHLSQVHNWTDAKCHWCISDSHQSDFECFVALLKFSRESQEREDCCGDFYVDPLEDRLFELYHDFSKLE